MSDVKILFALTVWAGAATPQQLSSNDSLVPAWLTLVTMPSSAHGRYPLILGQGTRNVLGRIWVVPPLSGAGQSPSPRAGTVFRR